jgi:hypothetical protein
MKLFAMYARKLLQQKLVLRHTGKDFLINRYTINSYLFNEFVCNLGFFWHEWASLKLE